MLSLTLRQYTESEPLDLPPEAFERLLTDYANRVEIKPAGGSMVRLRATNYVGLIRTPHVELVIQPKIDRLSVFWMLGFAHDLLPVDRIDFPLTTEIGLLDVLARLFAVQTETVIRRGIHRAYVEREDNLRFVRGRIEPLDDLRVNRGLRDRVACRFTELTGDVLHNRILLAATTQLLRYRFRLPGVHERLAWNAAHLAEVSPVPVAERDFTTIRYSRLNGHYRGVHALARLILRHTSFELDAGKHLSPSFLVNMDDVYEVFVRQILAEQARAVGLRLGTTTDLRLDEAGDIHIEPDIVLTDGSRIRAVFDAKYKRQDAQPDVYQALAYAKGLGLQRVVLVYPADGEVEVADHRIRHDDVEVLVRTIPVEHHGEGFDALENDARRVATALLREVLDSPDQALVA